MIIIIYIIKAGFVASACDRKGSACGREIEYHQMFTNTLLTISNKKTARARQNARVSLAAR